MYFNFNWRLGFVYDIIHVKFKEEPVPLINQEILPPLTPSPPYCFNGTSFMEKRKRKVNKKAPLEISKESTLY